MAMQPEQRAALERLHGYAEWRGGDDAAGAEVHGFELRGRELPGWRLAKARRNDALDPPRLETFWLPADGSEAMLGIRIVECPTVAAARESLLGILGDVESAAIRRRTDLDLGEVAFGQENMLAFARRNVVVVVRNAGRQVVNVLDAARRVDAVIVRSGTRR